MNRKLILDSSDEGRIEICYDSLSMEEIEARIRAYEKKYGMSYSQYLANSPDGCPEIDQVDDDKDWECLKEERAERLTPTAEER